MMKPLYLTILFFVLFVFNTQAQTTYYVSATNGSDSNNGTSASSPFASIRAAINTAVSGDEIRVTAETYPINSTLSVSDDINMKGGYNTWFTEQTGYTTLDGENARRVIEFDGISNSIMFDHFIIQNGKRYNGGGMYMHDADLSLVDIIFYNNTASGKGGAIFMEGSNPQVTNVAFIGNSSNLNGGALQLDGSFPTLTNVTFFDNYAGNTAGSIFLVSESKPVIRNTVFYRNKAGAGNANIDSYNWDNCYVDPGSSNNASQYNNNIDNNSAGATRYGDNATYVKLTSNPFANSSDPDGDDNIFGTDDDGLMPASQLKEKGKDSYNSFKYDLAGRDRKLGSIDIGAYESALIYYVVGGLETGNNDGSSWDNAFKDLSFAISTHGNTRGCIFRLAATTCTFGQCLEITTDIEIYGGYDVTTNTQTGYTTLDGQGAFRLINTEGLTSRAVFDHLIIQNGGGELVGGGMRNDNSSPTLTNVIFSNNSADKEGGGMYNNNSSPTLINVTFSGNEATYGGGMQNSYSASPTLTNVIFSENSANKEGGGMYNLDHSSPTLINATFIKNTAFRGGGINNAYRSSSQIYNSVFYANSISINGSGLDVYIYDDGSSITGINNASDRSGGGLQDTEGFILLTSDPFTNSGTPEGDDGEWGTSDDGLIPVNGSRLINTGDKSYNTSSTDISGGQRVQNDQIDIGAYETAFYAATFTYYVVGGLETGNNDGSSWDNAFKDLSLAISTHGNIRGCIFRLAATTCTFGQCLEITTDIEIYGGYDVTTNTQTGYTTLDGQGACRLINTKGLTSKAVFDHLIIQNGGGELVGGGMYNNNSSPTLINVTFSGNEATNGGGMQNSYSASPTLINVVFSDNSASYGGGMQNSYSASPTLTNVIFSGNSASNGGGGMYNYDSSPILTNVIFSDNSARYGGGMHNLDHSSPTLINVTFIGNLAKVEGGGMYNSYYASPTLINATFIKNTAFRGGGINNQDGSSSQIYNSVFYANSIYTNGSGLDIYIYDDGSSITGINNASDRSGGGLQDTEGFILLTSDPFTNSSTPEGADGVWGTSDDGLVPCEGSQLVDAGDESYNTSSTDMAGEQRVQHNQIDIGAYEKYFFTSIFTGSGSWGTDARWSDGVPDGGGTAIIDGECNITSASRTVDNLTINPAASLNIFPGAAITVNNTVTNNAGASGLVLKSDATETAQFINSTPDVPATVERYMAGNAWHLVSSPAPGGAISDFLAANTNVPTKDVSGTGRRGMMDYNESANDWNTFFLNSGQNGNLDAGKGFSLRTDVDGVVTFTGTLATGEVNATVARTGNYGWNCVGNPYPSAIAINSNAGASNFITSNYDSGTLSNSNLDPNYTSVYVWEQGAYTIISLGDEAFYAQAGQAFMVKVNTDKTTVQFTTAMQTHQPATAFKSGTLPMPELKLTASMDEKERTARIKFSDEMTAGLDVGYDAGVFKTGFDIYTKLVEDNGVDFGLQSLPETGMEQYQIPVGIDASASGEITFSLKSENLSPGIVPVLNDKLTGTSFSFENESDVYSTFVTDAAKGYGRFSLTFSSTTGINETGIPNFKAWYSEGYIYISGQMEGLGEATVYDINGRKVAIHQLSYSTQNRIEVPAGTNGIYLVKIKDSKRSEVLKVPVTGR